MATPETPAAETLLALDQIQGNIAGFNKPFQSFVFLSFAEKASAQSFLSVITREIDTADAVLDYKAERDAGREPADTRWFNLALTFPALQLLEATELETFEEAFQQGMRERAVSKLGDVDGSDPQNWVAPFQSQVHAVAILAADTPQDLEQLSVQLGHHCHAHAVTELGRCDGEARQGEGRGKEHFGFRDGFSQPGVQGMTETPKVGQTMIPAGEFIFGYPTQTDHVPPPPPAGAYDPQPAPPPKAFPSWAKDGSLLVLRRLRQDVGGFNAFVADIAGAVSMPEALVEAKLVGRYKSGAPLERTKDQDPQFDPTLADPSMTEPTILDEDKVNNFDFEPQDADGHLVPRAAHIRKAYPRNEMPPGQEESDSHRILRRGIPYGPDFQPQEIPYPGSGGPPPEQDRGLLFACYQASIERGFEFIQSQWANQPDFPQAGDGRDPITSQDVPDPSFSLPPDHHLTTQRWVITTGGEYFFSPSKGALLVLSGREPS
jgi:Dyp-type peroxidase family